MALPLLFGIARVGSIIFRAAGRSAIRGGLRGGGGGSGADVGQMMAAAAGNALRRTQRQIPFATSRALNATAKDIQAATLKDLPQKFTLRARGAPWYRPGTKFGFNIKFSTKANLTAVIGSQADWLRLHEEGGTKRAQGGRLTIPSDQWKPHKAILPASKRARRIMRGAKLRGYGGKPFVLKGSGGGGIYVRRGKERGPLVRLFSFESSAHIRKTLNFKAAGLALAHKNFAGHFARELQKAIDTAK